MICFIKWFAGAGILFLVPGLWMAAETMNLEQHSARANATVTRVERRHRDNGHDTSYHVEFRTAGGKSVRTELGKKPLQAPGKMSFSDFSIRTPVFQWLDKGDSLEVVYDRNDPRYALPAGTLWLIPQACSGIGLLLLLCAAGCLLMNTPGNDAVE